MILYIHDVYGFIHDLKTKFLDHIFWDVSVSVVKGLEPNSVDQTLKYAMEILKWDEEKPNFSFNEHSMYSSEASDSLNHYVFFVGVLILFHLLSHQIRVG